MRLSKGVETGPNMRRRLLLAGIGGVLPGVPAWARASTASPLVAFLMQPPEAERILVALRALGYAQERNLRVHTRGPANLRDLPNAAMQLITMQPAVLVADGPGVPTLAAFTRTIPIVCGGVPDPVGSGLAESLARPGRNVTGLATGSPDTAGLVFGLLKKMRPKVRKVGVLHAPGASVAVQMRAHREAAGAEGLEWIPIPIASLDDIDRAVPPLAGEALWLAPLEGRRIWRHALDVAHKHRIATIGSYGGSLMWYARDFSDAAQRIAAIIDRILKGADPAQIPFELPDRPVFVLNRTTARAVGIEIPQEVLLRATEVVD